MSRILGNSEAALARHHEHVLEIAERLSCSAPENSEFLRDLWGSYWRCASTTEGEAQTAWRRKVHSTVMLIQARGILVKNDKQHIAVVKTKLGIE